MAARVDAALPVATDVDEEGSDVAFAAESCTAAAKGAVRTATVPVGVGLGVGESVGVGATVLVGVAVATGIWAWDGKAQTSMPMLTKRPTAERQSRQKLLWSKTDGMFIRRDSMPMR